MASPSIADGGGAESRIRYELEQGSLSQHDDEQQTGSFPGGNFNDDDDVDGDAINSNHRPTNGRPSFLNGGEGHDSYSAEGEMPEDLASGRQGEAHNHLDDTQKDGLGGGQGIGGDEYDDDAEWNSAAMRQTYNDSPSIPGATQSDPAGGGAGGGVLGKRPFSRHRSPHQDEDDDHGDGQTHRDHPDIMGGATDQEGEDEAIVTGGVSGGGGGGGGGDGERQRHPSSDQETSCFKRQQQQQQQQQRRPGFLSGNRRPFRPGFHEACTNKSDNEGEDGASSHGGGGGGGGEESVGSPSSRFDPRGMQSGASAFSESDADDASNGHHTDPWGSSSKARQGNNSTREELEGEDEGDTEEGGAEGQAQKRQRQQRRKQSELLVGNGFSAIARCYAAANCAIRGVEADQRNMLEAEIEIREDLVTFGVRVKEATHLMQMQINAAFTEDSLGASGT